MIYFSVSGEYVLIPRVDRVFTRELPETMVSIGTYTPFPSVHPVVAIFREISPGKVPAPHFHPFC